MGKLFQKINGLTVAGFILLALRTHAETFSIELKIPPGYSMISIPLRVGANFVSEIFQDVPSGFTIFRFSENVYSNINQYDADFESFDNPRMEMIPGEGFYARNPTTSTITVVLTGTVEPGVYAMPSMGRGFHLIGSPLPEAGLLTSDLGFPPMHGDTVYQFRPDIGQYLISQYDSDLGGWEEEPFINLAEGFFLLHSSSTPTQWTREFKVQD